MSVPQNRSNFRRPLVLAIALAGLPAWAPLAVAQQQIAVRSYDIPAGPLSTALNRFAESAGIYLAGSTELTANKTSAGLRGSYSVADGLAALLRGSGLEAMPQGDGSYALRPRDTVLPAVSVRDRVEVRRDELPPAYAGGQVARGARLGVLGNKSVLDTPFSITAYTAQTIENQQARSIADVLVNDSAVQIASARTNIGEDFSLRGFPVASQDIALNGMYGLMPYFRVPIEMAERVEVLRGPSALLNGMSPSGSVGGAINVVSKRAANEPLTRVTASYLSDSIFGTHVDIGRRFGEQHEFGVRFNGAYRNGDSNIDKQSLEETVGSLGLDYTIEKLRLTADVIYQHEDIDTEVRQFQLGALTRIPDAPDGDLNYPGYGFSKMSDRALVLRGEYDFSEHLTAYAGYGDRRSKMNALAGNPMLTSDAGDFASAPAWQVFPIFSHSAEAGIRAAFDTGAIGHELSVGATRLIQNANIYFLVGAFPGRVSNIYNPQYLGTPSVDGFSGNALKYTDAELTSYAVADTLSFFDTFELTLGARRQQIEAQSYNANFASPAGSPPNAGTAAGPGYDESATTPVVGAVFKPATNVSIYANYIEGLAQGPTAPVGSSNAGDMFEPMETKQREFGVKVDWGRITTTAAAFEIERPSAFLENGRFGVNGEQRNRGVEFSVFGEIAPRVRLLGGGSYTDAELTRTEGGTFDGNHAVAVPKEQLNLGAEWDTPFAAGLTLTARALYTGKQYLDQANRLDIPDATRVDIGARYRLDVFAQPVTLHANIDNLFDEDYWQASTFGYLHVASPRTLQLSATVDF